MKYQGRNFYESYHCLPHKKKEKEEEKQKRGRKGPAHIFSYHCSELPYSRRKILATKPGKNLPCTCLSQRLMQVNFNFQNRLAGNKSKSEFTTKAIIVHRKKRRKGGRAHIFSHHCTEYKYGVVSCPTHVKDLGYQTRQQLPLHLLHATPYLHASEFKLSAPSSG